MAVSRARRSRLHTRTTRIQVFHESADRIRFKQTFNFNKHLQLKTAKLYNGVDNKARRRIAFATQGYTDRYTEDGVSLPTAVMLQNPLQWQLQYKTELILFSDYWD